MLALLQTLVPEYAAQALAAPRAASAES
jgi:hypothetical protein